MKYGVNFNRSTPEIAALWLYYPHTHQEILGKSALLIKYETLKLLSTISYLVDSMTPYICRLRWVSAPIDASPQVPTSERYMIQKNDNTTNIRIKGTNPSRSESLRSRKLFTAKFRDFKKWRDVCGRRGAEIMINYQFNTAWREGL